MNVPRSDVGIASRTLSVARPRAEEQPADDGREQGRQHELELDLVDRLLDERGAVEVDCERPALRAAWRGPLRILALTARADLDRVRAALLADAEARPRARPSTREMRRTSSKPSSTARDVLEVDRRALLAAHDQVGRSRGRCASPTARTLISRPRSRCGRRAARRARARWRGSRRCTVRPCSSSAPRRTRCGRCARGSRRA